jgi:drug/metabolite transporter (DMT)-like permease
LNLKKLLSNTIFLAIVACLLWSSAFAGIKIGLQYTPPLQFAGIRFIISGLMILPFCGPLAKTFQAMWQHRGPVLKVSLFQTFLLYALFYTGISRVPANITAMVIGASPLFISVLAHIMVSDDKMTLRKTFSILLGIAGVVIIATSREGDYSWEGGQEFWGIIILVVANICGGVGNVLAAQKTKGINPLVMNSAQLFIGGLALFLLSLPIESLDLSPKPSAYYVALGWLSFLSAAAFSIWFVLLQRPGVKVSELNIWKFIIPVFGALLAWMLIPEEKPQMVSIVGMVVISFSLVLLNVGKKARN